MKVYVRDKAFTDNTGKTINYNEFYIKFEAVVENDEFEEVDLVVKFDKEKVGSVLKKLLADNVNIAVFNIDKSTGKDGKIYYTPVINFRVNNSDYRVPVKMSKAELVLARIGLSI